MPAQRYLRDIRIISVLYRLFPPSLFLARPLPPLLHRLSPCIVSSPKIIITDRYVVILFLNTIVEGFDAYPTIQLGTNQLNY